MPPRKSRKAPVATPLPRTVSPLQESPSIPLWKPSTCAFKWSDIYNDRPFSPRPFQIATAERFLAGSDVILSAPTGSGKGVILDMLCAVDPKRMWVVIVPLKALEVELTQRLGKTATYVNSERKDPELLLDIREGKYRMVFLSVEMAASRKMQDSLEDDIVSEDRSQGMKFNTKFKINQYCSPEDPLDGSVAEALLEVLKTVILVPQQATAAQLKAKADRAKAEKAANKAAKQAEQDKQRAQDVEAGVKAEKGCSRCGKFNAQVGYRYFKPEGHYSTRGGCPSRDATPESMEVVAAAARLGLLKNANPIEAGL